MGRTLIIAQAISSSITCSYGLCISIWFLSKQNYYSAFWALMLGLSCGAVLHLDVLLIRETIRNWYGKRGFTLMKIIGILLSIAAIICGIVFIYLAISWNQKFNLLTFYTSGTLSLMTLKGSLGLFFISRKQINIIRYETDPETNDFSQA